RILSFCGQGLKGDQPQFKKSQNDEGQLKANPECGDEFENKGEVFAHPRLEMERGGFKAEEKIPGQGAHNKIGQTCASRKKSRACNHNEPKAFLLMGVQSWPHKK